MKQKKILFVCSGNTCRSVIAQAFFQKEIANIAPELSYQAHSAGTNAFEGDHPTNEAIHCLAKYGIDITTHRAKMVEESLLRESSYILTMTSQQRDLLREKFPMEAKKIFLLRPFCYQKQSIKNQEVVDPFGGSLLEYKKICSQMQKDIRKLVHYLRIEERINQDE